MDNNKFLYYNYIPTLANHIIDIPIHIYKSVNITPKHNYPPFIILNIKKNDTIFVKTDLLSYFFNKIYPLINVNFYLLTGVAGKDVDITFKQFLENDKIIKWIGTNIIWDHKKILHIPIGFQENERCRNGPADFEGGDQELLKELYDIKLPLAQKKDMLLITYIGNTHSSRNNIKQIFKDYNYVVFLDKLSFEDYMKEINKYKFVLCPRGCGSDTHRFWEVLLMGSIPIVEKNGLEYLYEKFPCIIVNNLQEINDELLKSYTMDELKKKNINKYLLLDEFTNFTKTNFNKI